MSARHRISHRSMRNFPNPRRRVHELPLWSNAMLMAASNPLLEFPGLPRFDAIEPAHVTPAIDELLTNARAAIEAVAANPHPATWDNVVTPLVDRLDRLDSAWSAVRHLNAVVTTPALRDA